LLIGLGIPRSGAGEEVSPADSVTAVAVEMPAVLKPPMGKRLVLGQLFTAIKERYPASPHADYADKMLRAIVDLRPGRDSTMDQVVAEEELQKVVESMSSEERYLRGPDALDTNGEGWTLVVGSFVDVEEAQPLVDEYLEKGYKADVMQGATRARVAVGQFPTLDDARAALEKFKDEFPPTTWFMDIQKPR
jgi:hypothetical protein